MFLVDSHCHLNMPRFKDLFSSRLKDGEIYDEKYSVDAVVNRAISAGVKYQLTIGETLDTSKDTALIVDRSPSVFRTVGIHPQETLKHFERWSETEISKILKEQCAYNKTVGIGEIGLDYSQGKTDEREQKRLFHLQLDIADELNFPVSIHSRDAQVDTIEILRKYPNVKGVIHCFSGEAYFAEAILSLGYYIAVGGVVTYKKTEELQTTLRSIPLDRLLLETDAPFLAPVPMRGKINEPAFVVHTAEKVAEILSVSVEEVAKNTSANFLRLFGKII